MRFPQINALLARVVTFSAKLSNRAPILVGLLVLPVLALAFIAGSTMSSRAVAAVTVAAKGDALSDLKNRSPGSRMGGVATKRKAAIGPRLANSRGVRAPQQRALGKVFDAPMPMDYGLEPLQSAGPLPAFDMSGLAGIPTDLALDSSAPGGWWPTSHYGAAPGTYLGLPYSSGGCAGLGCGTGGNTGGDRPPIPAVPEPQAWALMIMGFACVGAVMRKLPRRARLSHHA